MNFPFKKPKKVGKCRNKNLAKFAAKVKKNVVKSEVWFNNLYKKLEHSDDRFNEPFQSKYIPDVTNQKR